MNIYIKIGIGTAAALIWVLAIIIKAKYPAAEVDALEAMCQAALVGLGVTHLTIGSPEKGDQQNSQQPPAAPPTEIRRT